MLKTVSEWLRKAFIDKQDAEQKRIEESVRFVHVSEQLVQLPDELATALGTRFIVSHERGVTYNVGINMVKRLADDAGLNNKKRRRLRARLKRQHNSIAANYRTQAGAIA